MADKPDLYETYIRNAEGDTYYLTDIRKGLEDFLSHNGYRISFNLDGVVFTLRRDTEVDSDTSWLDDQLNQDSVKCAVTIRGHK